MAHETWLPQIVFAIALLAMLFAAIQRRLFVPIADGPQQGLLTLPSAEDDEEEREHPKRAPVRRRTFPVLTAAVMLTAAVRVAFLVALQR